VANNEMATETDSACIGIMCGRRAPVSLVEGKQEASVYTDNELRGRHPFCAPDHSSPSRLLLLPLVAHHHGSDALASVLMSSSEVSSLCSADTWQCDGLGLLVSENDTSPGNDWLRRFSRYWNLERHVLLAPHPDINMETAAFESELQNGPPHKMKKAGIKHVRVSYLIMWRPVCLGILSGSTHNKSVE